MINPAKTNKRRPTQAPARTSPAKTEAKPVFVDDLKAQIKDQLDQTEIGQVPGNRTPLQGKAAEPGLSPSILADVAKRGGNVQDFVEKTQAKNALSELASPAADNPYRQHIEEMHSRLAEAGLPTSAEGVRVHVMDSSGGHGASVARTVSGPVGTAPGADLRLGFHRSLDNLDLSASERARVGTLEKRPDSLGGYFEEGLNRMERSVHEKRADLKHVVGQIPKDHQGTTIANMSYGMSPARHGHQAADEALRNPKVKAEIAAKLGIPVAEVDRDDASRLIAEGIQARMDGASGVGFHKTVGKFESEMKKGREAGVFVIEAAGNDFDYSESYAGDPKLSQTGTYGASSSLHVGATILGEQSTFLKGAQSTNFSSQGAEMSAPGFQVPVNADAGTLASKLKGMGGYQPLGGLLGDPVGALPPAYGTNGTSFSAPYTAGVAALMVKANPEITPAQLEHILKSPDATTDLEGTRDGVGQLDPVRAVQLAADLSN